MERHIKDKISKLEKKHFIKDKIKVFQMIEYAKKFNRFMENKNFYQRIIAIYVITPHNFNFLFADNDYGWILRKDYFDTDGEFCILLDDLKKYIIQNYHGWYVSKQNLKKYLLDNRFLSTAAIQFLEKTFPK